MIYITALKVLYICQKNRTVYLVFVAADYFIIRVKAQNKTSCV